MMEADLYQRAIERLPYEPTERQDELLRLLCEFACRHQGREAIVLQGYAGTGKSSLVAALVQAITSMGRKCVMLAPTGRAAKVLAGYSRLPAYTIHKRLYRGSAVDPENTSFYLAPNRDRDTLFIVDEASMIPGSTSSRLLQHLVTHVYSSPGCAIIFVGDTAQLPPVGEAESVALNPDKLRGFGLNPYLMLLDEPLRHAARSGVLYNATRIRRRMQRTPLPLPQLWAGKFKDVKVVTSEYLAESIADSYRNVGQDETIVVTRSNRRAGSINQAIRGMVLYADEDLQRGERLVVSKNNYHWTSHIKGAQFIANGESAVVQRVVSREVRYGHKWADVELLMPDSGLELMAKINLTPLLSDAPSLSAQESTQLYHAVLAEKEKEVGAGSLLTAMRTDPYVNALQVKYGYCLTCHKAQGGQWSDVYIDLAGIQPDMLTTPDFYRWLYTALTRSTSRLLLINPSLEVH